MEKKIPTSEGRWKLLLLGLLEKAIIKKTTNINYEHNSMSIFKKK